MADNPNYPVSTAVINWFDSQGMLHIRLYSCDGYTVTEWCIDQPQSGWVVGQFSAPGSAVSATCWQAQGGVAIRVYCTFQDQTQEWCANPGEAWTQGNLFP